MYKELGSRIPFKITILCIAILCSKGSTLSAAENFVECQTRWGKVQCQVRTPPDINHCWLFYSPFCLMGSSTKYPNTIVDVVHLNLTHPWRNS